MRRNGSPLRGVQHKGESFLNCRARVRSFGLICDSHETRLLGMQYPLMPTAIKPTSSSTPVNAILHPRAIERDWSRLDPNLLSMICSVAGHLRGDYTQADYGTVIRPTERP